MVMMNADGPEKHTRRIESGGSGVLGCIHTWPIWLICWRRFSCEAISILVTIHPQEHIPYIMHQLSGTLCDIDAAMSTLAAGMGGKQDLHPHNVEWACFGLHNRSFRKLFHPTY